MTEPVPVRDAATVVLLRDGASQLEVWLLTRVTQMVFAGGMAVFPGGRVDADDVHLPVVGSRHDAVAARFGCEVDQARALLGAAVRETFEETGVLLSAPAADLAGARADVEAGRVSFGDLLREHGLAADPSPLHPWSRWVTPEGEVRRYDTRFFVCALPDGAQAEDVTTESSSAGWFGVADAIEQAQRGELGLLPPTLMTLASVAGCSSVAEVVEAAAARDLDPIQPTIRRLADGFAVELPDGTTLPVPRSLLP